MYLFTFSVKTFDEQTNIELIVLLDYDPSFPNLDQIVQTQNKPLMKWGDRQKRVYHEYDV